MNRGISVASANNGSLHLIFAVALLMGVLTLALSVERPRVEFPPLPNFGAIDRTQDKKAAFIDYLTPIVEYYNGRILEDRRHLQRVQESVARSGGKPSWADALWLRQLAKRYAVEWEEDRMAAVLDILARRVDIIPVPLVLVQAAKESSWGQSRFAVQAKNLFGEWCFSEGCGVKPKRRPDGARHEVRRFDRVSDSIRSYLYNLNTHPGYKKLRVIRQHLREHDQPVTAEALAEGLSRYSERREAYVAEVKAMIAQYYRFQRARAK